MGNGLFRKYTIGLTTAIFIMAACTDPIEEVTKEEAVTFAKQIESTIKKGDANFLDNSFDKKEFVNKMNLPNTQTANEFSKGITNKTFTIGAQIAALLGDQDSFEFIKYYLKNGRSHVIFRIYTDKDGSLNYHDYELIKRNGKTRIADVYIYISGENFSETMHNIYSSLYEKSAALNYSEDEKLAGLMKLKDVKQLMQKGRNKEAKEMYDDIPAYLKKSKAVMLINVLICSNLTSEEYQKAIDEFQSKFPDEPNMSLLMIDGYCMQKEYTKMLAAINTLDEQINKDPLLDYQRYLSYTLLEKKDSSLFFLKRLTYNMPDFQKGFIELISTDLQNGKQQEADSVIAVYRKKPKFDQEKLNTIVGYSKK